MKVLFISYLFPPIGGMTPLRVAYFARYLSLKGYNVDVLTIEAKEGHPDFLTDKNGLELIPPSVRVVRTYPGPLYQLSYRVFLTPKAFDHEKGSNRVRWRDKLIRKVKKAIKPFFIPDGRIEWVPWALSAGKRLMKENKYDLIVSYGYPFTCHLVAYLLKRKGRSLWIADYGDPWTFDPSTSWFPAWRKALDKKLETRLLKYADKIIVCTEETRRGYLTFYPFIAKNKFAVITNGYDLEKFNDTKPEISDKFRLVYTGKFYSFREAQSFFESLRGFKNSSDIEVIIAGDIVSDYREYVINQGLSDIVSFIGYQPHSRVVSLQKGSSILILFGWPQGYQIPAKLFEYFAARKPILVIRYDEKDIAARWVQNYRRGIVVNNDPQEIGSALKQLYSLWKQGKLDSSFNLEEITDFSWDRLAKKLEVVIQNVCKD